MNLNLQVYIFSTYDECVDTTRDNGIKTKEKQRWVS